MAPTLAMRRIGPPDPSERVWKRGPRDKRYSTQRWVKLRLRILARDHYRCFVESCSRRGDVADHIRPTYPGMPDAEFFDPGNLRASCRRHNAARGWASYAARELAGASSPVASRSSHHAVIVELGRKEPGHPMVGVRYHDCGERLRTGDLSVGIGEWTRPGCPPECPYREQRIREAAERHAAPQRPSVA